MSHTVVDDLTDPSAWEATAPDGGASDALVVEPGVVERLGGPTLAVRAEAPVDGHRAERTVAAVDLSLRSTTSTLGARRPHCGRGSAARPFFVELLNGSAALLGAGAANAWQRFIPLVKVPDVWQAVPLALDDLAPAVRSAVTLDPPDVRRRGRACRSRS